MENELFITNAEHRPSMTAPMISVGTHMHANIQEQLRSFVEAGVLHSVWNLHFDSIKEK